MAAAAAGISDKGSIVDNQVRLKGPRNADYVSRARVSELTEREREAGGWGGRGYYRSF